MAPPRTQNVGPTDVRPSGQIPTPDEARRLALENPDLVRRQLLESGLSESEIRARLNAAGFPADALDQLLSGEEIEATAADAIVGRKGRGGQRRGLLIFVDGVRIGYSDGSTLFDELNPNDIESIEVIKGPAAEGVIQIVTKEAAADSA